MRISCVLLSFVLLLLSVGFTETLAVRGAHAARIPEHTCRKQINIGSNICDLQRCNKECSREPAGIGECRDAICFCTYYCKQPPAVSN